jgi:serine/threonine protein kinase
MGKNEDLPVIPGYRIEKKLGRGGMADVYLGVQEVLGRKVAIKVLAADMIQNLQVVERFLNEARTASRLEHPNIVTIHDVGQVEDTCYIVMEYLPESLVSRMESSPGHKLKPGEVFRILKRMAMALDYAHREGFIHRDIKPDNILFRKDNTPVLVDFGIARAVDSSSQLTTSGMIIGTPHYMSPEQCQGEKIDGRSDLYSLGIVLYEMLTGDIPYRADSAAGVLVKHIQEPIPHLPVELQRYQPLLNRMVAKSKAQRVQTGKEVLELLERFEPKGALATIEISHPEKWVFQKEDDSASDEFTTLTPYKSGKKRSSSMWGMVIILLLLGAAAAYYYLEYLPASREKQSALHSRQTGEKEIKVNEPEVITQNKEGSPQTIEKAPGSEIKDKEYRQYLALAKDFYKKGNYRKAKESIASAGIVKKTAELELLAREIREKEEALRRQAQQERLRQKRDDDAFDRAKSSSTIFAYEKYLEKYPSGRHAQEAQKRMDELKSAIQLENKIQDDVAFEIASGKNTVPAYRGYLQKFPYGLHTAEANAKIKMLKEKVIRETREKIELVHIKFFESGTAKAQAVGQRQFNTRFPRETTRFVITEIKYKNKLYQISDSTSRVVLEYSSSSGGFGSYPIKGVIESLTDAEDGIYSVGMGWPQVGKWLVGTYTVSVSIDDKRLGQSTFEIY